MSKRITRRIRRPRHNARRGLVHNRAGRSGQQHPRTSRSHRGRAHGTAGLVPPPPPEPTAYNRTRLLIPFVSNQAGFDTGVAIVNTGLDSTGQVGRAGRRRPVPAGSTTSGASRTARRSRRKTTNRAVAAGETFTFTFSGGGSLGIPGTQASRGTSKSTAHSRSATDSRSSPRPNRPGEGGVEFACTRVATRTQQHHGRGIGTVINGANHEPTQGAADSTAGGNGGSASCATLDTCFTLGARGRRWTGASRSSGPSGHAWPAAARAGVAIRHGPDRRQPQPRTAPAATTRVGCSRGNCPDH